MPDTSRLAAKSITLLSSGIRKAALRHHSSLMPFLHLPSPPMVAKLEAIKQLLSLTYSLAACVPLGRLRLQPLCAGLVPPRWVRSLTAPSQRLGLLCPMEAVLVPRLVGSAWPAAKKASIRSTGRRLSASSAPSHPLAHAGQRPSPLAA